MRPIKFRAVLHLDKFDEKIPAIDIMIDAVAVYPGGSIGFPEEALKEKLPKGYAIYSNEFGANIYYSDEEGEYFENVFELLAGDEWFWVEKDFDLMQFTGLKDKNGVEIYEGDIIQYDCEDGIAVAEVLFEESESENKFMSGFAVKVIEIKDYPKGEDENPIDFEVVGNKYEGVKNGFN